MKSVLIASQLLPEFDSPVSAAAIDLAMDSDTVLGVIGPDMSIKSAWIKCLTGIEASAQGELMINEHDAIGMSRKDWQQLRTECVYMDDETALVSVFNVQENILLPASYHKLNTRQALLQRMETLLQQLGFKHPRHLSELPAYVDDLEIVQAIIARALLLQPALVSIGNIFNLIGRHQASELLAKTMAWSNTEKIATILGFHNNSLTLKYATALLYVSDSQSCYYKTREEYEKSRVKPALS